MASCKVISKSGTVIGSYIAIDGSLANSPWAGNTLGITTQEDYAGAPSATAADTAQQTRLANFAQALVSATPGTLTNAQRDAALQHIVKWILGQ